MESLASDRLAAALACSNYDVEFAEARVSSLRNQDHRSVALCRVGILDTSPLNSC